MKILLAEYTMSHDPSLAPEGLAMYHALKDSFHNCGHSVVSPKPGAEFKEEILTLGPACDLGLIIAPDHLLARYTKCCEDTCRSIGCNSMTIAICANKRTTSRILSQHGIDVPREVTNGIRIIKPIMGAGSQGVRITDEPCNRDELQQEYISGESLSVSLIAARVCGESCTCYSGKKPLVLSVNKQDIRIDDTGYFHYRGGKIPYPHPRQDEIKEIAINTVKVLGCQGYIGIDMVVNEKRVVVVDVNPRPTDSIIGLSRVLDNEIGDLLIRASYGDLPDAVQITNNIRFDITG
ncbi:MAG: ATP-grasp domain-containing protein [Methanospirillaceae archaeon]|nr:ATP-grasp domain-containing protein [Methanospirillaceae archaeon]